MMKPAYCLPVMLLGAPAWRVALSAWLLAAPMAAVHAADTANTAKPPHRTVTIVIEAMRFSPESVELHKGDTVIWHNQDPFPHTVWSPGRGGFSSPEIAAGESWEFTAASKGILPYICTLHTTMKGKLTVK